MAKPKASLDEPRLVAAFVLTLRIRHHPNPVNASATALQREAQILSGPVLLAAHSLRAEFEPPCLPARHRSTIPASTRIPRLVQRFFHVGHVARKPSAFASLPYVWPFKATIVTAVPLPRNSAFRG